MPTPKHPNITSMNRRELLRVGGLSLMGLTGADLLARPAAAQEQIAKAKSCILLFMWGGPSQLETWDPKPDAPAEVRGEFGTIPTTIPGYHIGEHFPLLARRTDKLAVVRSMTHDNGDHLTATHYLLTGHPPPVGTDKRAEWPNIGAVLSKLGRNLGPLPSSVALRPKLENTVPRFVESSRGQHAGWLGPVHDPLIIDQNPSLPGYKIEGLAPLAEVSVSRLENRKSLLESLDRLRDSGNPNIEAMTLNQRRAFDLISSAALERGAFELHEEPEELRRRYGLNPHGQSVLQARRLVERGVPLVTVYWPNDGIKDVSVYWDTHSRNFVDLKERLMPVADQAFSALLDDLSDRGLLDETLVIWTGEFGRTPKVGQRSSDAGAGADGRDHWPGCFSTVLAGGGIRGGTVYGRSDKQAAFPAENPVKPADLVATVYHLLGITGHDTIVDPTGRPHYIFPGKPVRDLIG